ncbi:hypothetical protein OG389_13620 [Streptomyces sp. NBC_00435]|uniref:hypothetical protein n=1 Tax=Streptomyces sp. NBC_00435 TaxID=2903649 RepID=UPI002E227357
MPQSQELTLLPADGYRAVFYRHPVGYSKNDDGTYNVPRGDYLIYAAPVIRFGVNTAIAKASVNGSLVGVAYVQTREGAINAFHRTEGDFLGIAGPAESTRSPLFQKKACDKAREITAGMFKQDQINTEKAATLAGIKEEN